MPDAKGVQEVTEPISIELVDDRMHFTVVSGQRCRTYSISLHKARNAAMCAASLLDGREREQRVVRLEAMRGG